jgi:hypothetical protein
MLFALITFHRAAKDSVSALRTYISGLFISNPFFGTEFSSIRNSTQNDLLANGHGKIINVIAGKFIALMTPAIPFLHRAFSDLTLAAMHESFIR